MCKKHCNLDIIDGSLEDNALRNIRQTNIPQTTLPHSMALFKFIKKIFF